MKSYNTALEGLRRFKLIVTVQLCYCLIIALLNCREELKELRQQMGDIEKSLMQQVITNEKRAEEALVSHTH